MAPCNGTTSTPPKLAPSPHPTIEHYNGTLQWHHIHSPKVGRHPPATAPWWHVQSAKVVRRPPPLLEVRTPIAIAIWGTNPRLHRNVKFPNNRLAILNRPNISTSTNFRMPPLIVAGPSPECLTKEAAHLRSAKRFVHGRDLASHSPLRPKRPIDPEITVISALVTQSKCKHLENNISSSWDSLDEKNFNHLQPKVSFTPSPNLPLAHLSDSPFELSSFRINLWNTFLCHSHGLGLSDSDGGFDKAFKT